MPAAKKPAAKKPAGKKPAGKKPAGKKKVSPALTMKYKPDAALAAVIGATPATRGQITKKIWEYIKKHKLQDKNDGRIIHCDAKLKKVFGGKGKIGMLEIAGHVGKHITKQ
jgi:chromatin remodeling complex protein RSC6